MQVSWEPFGRTRQSRFTTEQNITSQNWVALVIKNPLSRPRWKYRFVRVRAAQQLDLVMWVRLWRVRTSDRALLGASAGQVADSQRRKYADIERNLERFLSTRYCVFDIWILDNFRLTLTYFQLCKILKSGKSPGKSTNFFESCVAFSRIVHQDHSEVDPY